MSRRSSSTDATNSNINTTSTAPYKPDGISLKSASAAHLHADSVVLQSDDSFPTQLSDLIFSNNQYSVDTTTTSNISSIYRTLDSLRKSTLSIPKRLTSILEDSTWLTDYIDNHPTYSKYPLIANERCGSWYIPPARKSGSAYFKSTDGHHGQWRLSTRRLNLSLLETLGTNGGAVLVDSTRRGKGLPDALRRTVPIWVAVWNLVLFGHNRLGTQHPDDSRQRTNSDNSDDDTTRIAAFAWVNGIVQNCGLEQSEIQQIESRVSSWVDELKALGLDFQHLRSQLRRPIRCVWVIHDEGEILPNGWTDFETSVGEQRTESEWNTLVLCSVSKRVIGAEMSENGYIQGAGDDSEGWSQGLTSTLFWKHQTSLLTMPEDELPDCINKIVNAERRSNGMLTVVHVSNASNIDITAGGIDEVQQVLDNYDLIICCNGTEIEVSKEVLLLCCRTGKLGSRDLREKLSLVEDAASALLQKNRDAKILIMCETGKDLSVGVVLVLLCLMYNDLGELDFQKERRNINKQMIKQKLVWITSVKPDANPSRSTLQAVNSFLIERPP